jgi:HEAT repeat protein
VSPRTEALALRAAESDPENEVQAAAVRTLGFIEASSALGVARAALITPSRDDVIRIAGLDVLGTRAQPAEALKAALEYSGEEYPAATRRAAVQMLSRLSSQNRNARVRLIELLNGGPVDLRVAAAEALAGIDAWNEIRDRLGSEPLAYVRHRLRKLLPCR